MTKKVIAALLAVLLLLGCAMSAVAESASLLDNGGFETLTADGEPSGWYQTAYRAQEGYSRLSVTDERAHSGTHSAMIENASQNDARYTCTVNVEPESLYRLSGYVLVERMEDIGAGANLAIEGIYSLSDRLFDTSGDWQYLEWYGETGENQKELTIGVRVGGYSAESVGKAYFDDIKLEKVDALPDDVVASIWYKVQTYDDTTTADTDAPQKSTALFVALALAFLLALWLGRGALRRGRLKASHAALVLGGLMLLALAVRVWLGMTVEGYAVDINCFKSWSLRMANVGPSGFYLDGYFCDYPPGYLLLLWPCGLLLNAVGSRPELALLIVKLVPILCDLLGALILYRHAAKRVGYVPALMLAAMYLFNPAVLVNGSAWGQVDSLLALLMVVTAIFAMDKRWRVAIPLFIVSVLVKPQALLFAPIGGMWLIVTLLKARKESGWALREVFIGLGLGLLAAAVIVTPFALRQPKPLSWLFSLYGETLASYAKATLNTANLYYLAGANWTELTSAAPTRLIVAMACVMAALGVLFLWRQTGGKPSELKREPLGKLTLLGMMHVLCCLAMLVMCFAGVTYSVFGYAMMAYAFLFAIICLVTDGRADALPFYMALSLIGVYMLGIKIHERYLFPALLLLLLSYARMKDRRVLWLFVGLSATTFVNTAIVLDNSILFGSSLGHLNSDTLALNIILCIINLALMGFAGYIAVSGLRESAPATAQDDETEQPKAPPSYEAMLLSPKDARLHLRMRDWLLMLITAVLYGILALTNLGSTVAPQTGWVSTSADEQLVFELPESTTFKMLYYAGVSYNDFSISVSEDGQSWSNDFYCDMRQDLCYRWNYALQSEVINGEPSYSANEPENVLWLVGKYIRVNACEAGLNLWEIVLRDKAGNNLPLTFVSQTNAAEGLLDEPKPPQALIDEQSTCVGEPSWYNGMYFDEIYHARTAYEYLHGSTSIHEWTHPPLGKLMMSACIAIFGMTPFGWRFAGAFIGILMLPALYLLILQLTKKRSLATVGMLAFSLDLMHFAQTRIATIDTFPVFFILLTFICMTRYLQTDVFAVAEGERQRVFTRAFVRSLIPLCLCGVFMGLSIASKWTGLYSAVGLAALFFIACYRQYRAGLVACSYDLRDDSDALPDEQKRRILSARDFTMKRILVTCGFCVLFFIAIPCLIYYLSYIPHLAPGGPVTIKRILAVQENMLNYHSKPGLGMDHPFQSQWWQWPLNMKPIWYCQDHFEPEGYASTIFGMGNPWIFVIGAVCMLAVLVVFAVKALRLPGGLRPRHGDGDLTLMIIVIGFLAQYLPWMLVPRSMYIYHYFASVPFIIIATLWMIDRVPEQRKRLRYILMAVYLAGAAAMFVFYFPYASGVLTSTEWLETAKQSFRPAWLIDIATGDFKTFLNSYFRIYY